MGLRSFWRTLVIHRPEPIDFAAPRLSLLSLVDILALFRMSILLCMYRIFDPFSFSQTRSIPRSVFGRIQSIQAHVCTRPAASDAGVLWLLHRKRSRCGNNRNAVPSRCEGLQGTRQHAISLRVRPRVYLGGLAPTSLKVKSNDRFIIQTPDKK